MSAVEGAEARERMGDMLDEKDAQIKALADEKALLRAALDETIAMLRVENARLTAVLAPTYTVSATAGTGVGIPTEKWNLIMDVVFAARKVVRDYDEHRVDADNLGEVESLKYALARLDGK